MMPIRIGPAKSDKLVERIKGAITRLKVGQKETVGDIHKKKTPHRGKIHDTGVFESLTKGYDGCRHSLSVF